MAADRDAEIEWLQAALAEADARAEEAASVKRTFLRNMSHELRTPLNAIIGYAELLEEDARAEGRAPLAADLDRIRAAGLHLLDLINQVLDIAKVEAGKTEVFVEDLNNILNTGEVGRPIDCARLAPGLPHRTCRTSFLPVFLLSRSS